MITLNDVIARIARLDELTRGLAREIQIWKESTSPLLYMEQAGYLKAIHDALTAIETARIQLAQARLRIGSLLNDQLHEPMTMRDQEDSH